MVAGWKSRVLVGYRVCGLTIASEGQNKRERQNNIIPSIPFCSRHSETSETSCENNQLVNSHEYPPPRSTNMRPEIMQTSGFSIMRHKFDQLFTANEQTIPLNTFSNTHHSKGIILSDKITFLAYVTAFSVAGSMSRGVNLGNQKELYSETCIRRTPY